MRNVGIIITGILLLSFAAGVFFYEQLPEEIASHWNAQGQVDGYMPKFWALFLMPLISIGLFLLFVAIPKIDPLRRNIEKFRKYYDRFVLLVIGFLFYVYMLTILWNLGMRFNIMVAILPALAILFYYCGILVENAKQNWFIGIRTPWTLSSEKVWDKTHRLGGRLFKICGIIALAGFLLPEYAIFLVLLPLVFVAALTIVYSYVEYQKEKA